MKFDIKKLMKKISFWKIIMAIACCILLGGAFWFCLRSGFSFKNDSDDFAINVFTEMIGVVVTVFLINFILAKQREGRIKRLNGWVNSRVRYAVICGPIKEILELCELKKSEEEFGKIGNYISITSNFNEEETLKLFCEDPMQERILDKIGEYYSVYCEDNKYFIEHLSLIFKSLYDLMGALLKKVDPYSNPEADDIIVGFNMIQSNLKNYGGIITKVHLRADMNEEQKQEALNTKINPFLKKFFDENLRKWLKFEFQSMLRLIEMAKKNKLAYDLN
ncbi:MAG: hypothetical protein KAS66_06940 [Candidatus Omnitrophica bacterium]|nr:hypothetical protein [Candidatus Omnitrophota bacterium]